MKVCLLAVIGSHFWQKFMIVTFMLAEETVSLHEVHV
jgi:hypothetical protein